MPASLPLAGRRILVTRPEAQAGDLCDAITTAGGDPLRFPLLDIVAAPDAMLVNGAAATHAAQGALVIFVSPNAVHHGLPYFLPWPAAARAAAVGAGTAQALTNAGIPDVLLPAGHFDSEGLLALPELAAAAIAGREILMVRGNGGRELLEETLSARGATVIPLTAYHRTAPAPERLADLREILVFCPVDAITLSSSEMVASLATLFSGAQPRFPAWQEALGNGKHAVHSLDWEGFIRHILFDRPLFVTHPRIAETARVAGFTHVVQTATSDAGLVEGLCAYNWPPIMTDTSQPSPVQSSTSPPPFWRRARFWGLLALALLVGWQWWETQRRLASAHKALRQGYAESEKRTRDAEQRLARAVEATEALERKYSALAARQEEFQGEATALRQIYQDAAQTREDALIADMEQNLNFAAQQLQLAGNVRAAIIALSGLDERLARNDNPLFLPVRRALAKELEQLRATPFVDISGMSLRLENVITGIDTLPLTLSFNVASHQPQPVAKTTAVKNGWRQGLQEAWQEVKGMVRIQRFDRREPVLLRPDQALILRENLKLRLLNARLALFAHDQATFRGELKAAAQLLEQYFNTREKPVIAVREAIAALAATELNVEFPNLNDSLIAIQTLKSNREKR
ncbi:MAG: uroporphyrinogen-III C-methyltransferase [Zoogloeaceae bacterium]|jgi:uncharacterized protein HemX/uroporphyrinogen-III synthase|nr:uroporphyrinogen-III C-methyltransferase [Zoogloeaceae bacterium]